MLSLKRSLNYCFCVIGFSCGAEMGETNKQFLKVSQLALCRTFLWLLFIISRLQKYGIALCLVASIGHCFCLHYTGDRRKHLHGAGTPVAIRNIPGYKK